jgi:hypothetical protein
MSGTPWWRRWLGGAPAADEAIVKQGAATAPAPAPAAPDPTRAPAGALRRPLIGRDGRVAAFEWLLGGAAERPAADWVALLHAAPGADPRAALVTVPAAVLPALLPALQGRPLALGKAASPWLALPELPTPEQATRLRALGLCVGAPAGPPVAEPALDFVHITAAGAGLETLMLAEERWREHQPRIKAVALGLSRLDEAEQLLARGFHWAGGRLARGAAAAPGSAPLGAAAHRICALLAQLAQDADTAPLVAAVRGDVALGYRLLRYANSASVGLAQPVDSVERAVAVLGRRELQRWLQVMLLATAPSRPAQRALQEHALVRARLLERLAERRGGDDARDAGALFTLGLASTLDTLLQVPLATAIAPLRLRDEAQEALLQGRGPWAPQLALLAALDEPDESRAWQAAEAIGAAAVLDEEAAAAWAWAAQTGEG